MNQPNDDHLDLQQQLDEAGRLCRPRHPGWDTLLERLPRRQASDDAAGALPTTSRRPHKTRRWGTLVLAASILVAVTLGTWLLLGPRQPAQAESLPIEVRRRGIRVTVFNASGSDESMLYMPVAGGKSQQNSGMALVQDERMVLHLKQGDNTVKFTDVAASIDPTSVRLVSDTDPLGTKVVEQNFEYDLASGDALLRRALEQKVTCIGTQGEEVLEGYLISYDDQAIALADQQPSSDRKAPRPRTRLVSRAKLKAIRLDHKPADLYTRPTLVWKLRTDQPGDHLTTLSYLCGNAVWQADYVAVITDSQGNEDTLDLKSWVTIDNRSGTTYEDARLKLIAGDVNRVRDVWAGGYVVAKGVALGQPMRRLGRVAAKKFSEKSFFEYKLYTLDQPSTIKDRQVKQLSLFKAEDIKARRRYLCRSQPGTGRHVDIRLVVKNKKENHLGRPLPKGRWMLTAIDADGDSQMLGRYDVDHTAKDEELKLDVGRALDIIYDFRVVETRLPAEKQMIRTYEFRIRNHKPSAIDVEAIGDLREQREVWDFVQTPDGSMRGTRQNRESSSRTVVEASHDFTLIDHRTVRFDVRLAPDSQQTITYTVDYRW